MKAIRTLLFAALPLLFPHSPAEADQEIDCGQNARVSDLQIFQSQVSVTTDPVTIDYAVFYTPQARDTQGGTAAMLSRIETAFADANGLFTISGAALTHRVVHVQELPISNTSQTLPELNTELATQFNFFEVLDAVQADSSVIIVDFQIPGGFANIPGSRSQARNGGAINLGLPNLSGLILAHEIGHTLGVGHDYAEASSSSFFDIPPTYNYGNNFIGSTTGLCYRCIMSARTTCRVAGFSGQPTVQSSRFSSPTLLFDGTPTGDAANSDAVRMFAEYGPFVASARGVPQLPPSDPGSDPEDEGDDTLTLRLGSRNGRLNASGRCLSADESALTGDSIGIYRITNAEPTGKLVKSATCTEMGKYNARLSRPGRYLSRNGRTGTESPRARISR